jgi:outer membrane lipoprotein-sorting protein
MAKQGFEKSDLERILSGLEERQHPMAPSRFQIVLLGLAWIVFGYGTANVQAQEKVDPARWLREAEQAFMGVDNYVATFHKQERVEGQLQDEETILFKFKKPFKVYMKWIRPPFQGRELIYVEGWNNSQARIHEGGIFGIITVNINPKGPLAMRRNRHPVTSAGIDRLLRVMAENLRRGTQAGDLTVLGWGEERVYSRKTQRFEAIFPERKAKDYYGRRIIVNLDVENRLPIRIEIYDEEDQLVEKYGYENLKLNPGLTDLDFDPKNPEYKF